ncbi:uncharacterized protein LOC112045515 [Bicyclus anynana]|uniref:Uncharacterized protein LOC112045515 n=1 Tax=Bicyclus anynana TaxID=110368 RepID=A0ABM3M6A8_BICAN|nr:uncharacterized protein LOC112045515 [Bicyclus anynana]
MKEMSIKENKKQKPFSERLDTATSLSNSQLFVKNFCNITHQAQDFILMQLKLAGKKKKAMRYTTNEKLLSLSLMKESPKGYRLLQKIFNLPTKRTLNRLAENITFDVGINDNIFKILKNKAQKWTTKKKLCSILFDEVALTPHLTYVESQDEIRGFKDLGNNREFKFCDHALVFMLRGVCSKWRQPISFYFCEGTTAAVTVVQILKEVVTRVCESSLIPVAVVCDQGSTFRTAINILKRETERKKNLNEQHYETYVDGETVSATMKTTSEAVLLIDQLFGSVDGSQRDSVKGKLRGPVKPNSNQFDFWNEAKAILKNIQFIDKNSRRAQKNKKTYKVKSSFS